VPAFELLWEPASVTGIALPERLRELPATAYVGRLTERERLTALWGRAREGEARIAETTYGETRMIVRLRPVQRQQRLDRDRRHRTTSPAGPVTLPFLHIVRYGCSTPTAAQAVAAASEREGAPRRA
jgi:hypothetical protein